MRTSVRSTQTPQKQRHQRKVRPPSNGKVGMPQIYDPVRFPHIAKVLCAEYGFTAEQLGKVFGVSKRTVQDWMMLHEEFKTSVHEGKDVYDGVNVENALLRRALGYTFEEKTQSRIWVNGKDAEGKEVKIPAKRITTVVKEIPPDVKAAIFWLANRQPERWKIQSTINANVQGSIEHKHKHASLAVTAKLDQMNDNQLLMLRDIVASQQPEVAQIGHNSQETELDMRTILAEAERIQNDAYDMEDDRRYID